jgi:hypothetical protein
VHLRVLAQPGRQGSRATIGQHVCRQHGIDTAGTRADNVAAVGVVAAAIQGYGLEGADLIHAIRVMRSACHGLATLEAAVGFGLPESVDETFARLVDALDTAFAAFHRAGR